VTARQLKFVKKLTCTMSSHCRTELATCVLKLNVFNYWLHVERGQFSTPDTGDMRNVLSTVGRRVVEFYNLHVECLHVDSV